MIPRALIPIGVSGVTADPSVSGILEGFLRGNPRNPHLFSSDYLDRQRATALAKMSSFSDLPTELTTDILSTAISQHPIPSRILAVNSHFNDIGQRIIYTSLRFKSESQLVRFALKRHLRSPRGQLAHRSHLRIHQYTCARQEANGASDAAASTAAFGETSAACQGGTSDTTAKLLPYTPRSISVWVPGGQGYGAAFEEIKRVFELCAEVAGERVLELESLEFCLHSRMSDSAPWKISEALSLVKCVLLFTGF